MVTNWTSSLMLSVSGILCRGLIRFLNQCPPCALCRHPDVGGVLWHHITAVARLHPRATHTQEAPFHYHVPRCVFRSHRLPLEDTCEFLSDPSRDRLAYLISAQTFDPKKRLTVDQALEHPYLAAYVCRFIVSEHKTGDSYAEPLYSMIRMMSPQLTLLTRSTLSLTVSLCS